MAYISSREIGNVALRPARLEVGHYDNILGIYDTPAPATSELANAQSAYTRSSIYYSCSMYGSIFFIYVEPT